MLAQSRAGRWARVPAATWLAWLLPVFAWAPLTYPGYFEFLDGFSPIFNLDDFLHRGAGLAWLPPYGQPYDLLRGEGWLPYLLAAPLRSIGMPGVSAVKIVLGASIMAGALGTYFWARRRLGPWPGLLGSAAYVFWPVGLATLYVRGAFAAAVLLGLMPLACWAADAVLHAPRWGRSAGLALALAATFWTQTGLALWFAGMLLAYLLLAPPGRSGSRSRRAAAVAWLAGVLAGILGLLPAAIARGLPDATYVAFGDHFAGVYELLQSGWGAIAGAQGGHPDMPLQLGLVASGLAAIGVFLLSSGRRPGQDEGAADRDEDDATAGGLRTLAWLHVALALVAIALCLTLARPLWAALPLLQRTLTYPWQLLLLAGPWLAWLAGLGGLMLAGALLAAVPARRAAADAQPQPGASAPAGREPGTDEATRALAGARVLGNDGENRWTLPLFASLIVLVVLGVYGDLNPPSTAVKVPERPLAVFGENQLALLTADVAPVPSTGITATVRARWQALRPLTQDYTVFVHALGPDGTVLGQQDTMPKGNEFPTSRWQSGAVVEDEYTVTLRPGAPAGEGYRYDLGLYQYRTGERLRTEAGDKVTLDGR